MVLQIGNTLKKTTCHTITRYFNKFCHSNHQVPHCFIKTCSLWSFNTYYIKITKLIKPRLLEFTSYVPRSKFYFSIKKSEKLFEIKAIQKDLGVKVKFYTERTWSLTPIDIEQDCRVSIKLDNHQNCTSLYKWQPCFCDVLIKVWLIAIRIQIYNKKKHVYIVNLVVSK